MEIKDSLNLAVSRNSAAIWWVTQCEMLETFRRFRGTYCCILILWYSCTRFPTKQWQISTRRHGVTSKETEFL